jgi:hypothetical protein
LFTGAAYLSDHPAEGGVPPPGPEGGQTVEILNRNSIFLPAHRKRHTMMIIDDILR